MLIEKLNIFYFESFMQIILTNYKVDAEHFHFLQVGMSWVLQLECVSPELSICPH